MGYIVVGIRQNSKGFAFRSIDFAKNRVAQICKSMLRLNGEGDL